MTIKKIAALMFSVQIASLGACSSDGSSCESSAVESITAESEVSAKELSVSDVSAPNEEQSAYIGRNEEILKLFENFGDFYRGYMDCRVAKNCTDTTEKMTEIYEYEGNTVYCEYYKLVSGEHAPSDAICTENIRAAIFFIVMNVIPFNIYCL